MARDRFRIFKFFPMVSVKIDDSALVHPKGRLIDHNGIIPDVVMEKVFDRKLGKNQSDTPE